MAFQSKSGSNMWTSGPNYDDYLDSDDEGVMYTTMRDSSESDDENESCFSSLKALKKGSEKKPIENDGLAIAPEQDEFEQDMAAELSDTLKKLTAAPLQQESAQSTGEASSKKENPTTHTHDETFYDPLYFDSDDSDGEKFDDSNKPQPKRKVLTNDELFYDPDMDDMDQAYVDKARRRCQVKHKKSKGKDAGSNPEKLPNSDAVLNCPACFTTLCLDCQRHSIYHNQYRAMFVFNCGTDFSEKLNFPKKMDKKKFNKMKKQKAKSLKKGEKSGIRDTKIDMDSVEISLNSVDSGKFDTSNTISTEISGNGLENIKIDPNIMNSGSVNRDLCTDQSDLVNGRPTQNTNVKANLMDNSIENNKIDSGSMDSMSIDTDKPALESNIQYTKTETNPILDSDLNTGTGTSNTEFGTVDTKVCHQKTDVGNTDVKSNITESKLVKHVSNMPKYHGKHGRKDIVRNLSGKDPKNLNNDTKKHENHPKEHENDMEDPDWEDLGASLPENDTFYPVKCTVCNTKVAVYDSDEIYHFFGVLASY